MAREKTRGDSTGRTSLSPIRRALRLAAVTALAAGVCSAALSQASFVSDGQAGFVVSHIEYALSRDAGETGACPDGMTAGYGNMGDVFPDLPDLQRQEGEKEDDYIGRVFRSAFGNENAINLCQNPEAGKPDPNWRPVKADVPAFGIDLDGENSRDSGVCPHTDFPGMNGEAGVDNQFYRVVGCSNSYQSTGQSNGYVIEMLTGAWGILITLGGVDDIRNDDEVEVGVYANADPIQLSPNREPLEFATYAVDQDPRFLAETRGRIVDGVLTTDPVDVRFHKITNSIYLERPLRDARLHMTLSEEGVLDGYLAGYTPVEDMYDLQYGYRNGKNASGEAADFRLRSGSAIGQAFVLGHTCDGAYYALHEHADGHPDPDTGKCTSISTQYRITAIPAFVVDEESKGINEDLIGAQTP